MGPALNSNVARQCILIGQAQATWLSALAKPHAWEWRRVGSPKENLVTGRKSKGCPLKKLSVFLS